MDVAAKLASLLGQLNTVIVGKEAQVRDCVACLLAGGHLLIEDVPGVGKTTLAHALSHTFGLHFSRVVGENCLHVHGGRRGPRPVCPRPRAIRAARGAC